MLLKLHFPASQERTYSKLYYIHFAALGKPHLYCYISIQTFQSRHTCQISCNSLPTTFQTSKSEVLNDCTTQKIYRQLKQPKNVYWFNHRLPWALSLNVCDYKPIGPFVGKTWATLKPTSVSCTIWKDHISAPPNCYGLSITTLSFCHHLQDLTSKVL